MNELEAGAVIIFLADLLAKEIDLLGEGVGRLDDGINPIGTGGDGSGCLDLRWTAGVVGLRREEEIVLECPESDRDEDDQDDEFAHHWHRSR